MAVARTLDKIATWVVRLFQLFFAIILMGVLSYMVHEFHKFGFHAPREVVVPEVFSVLAIVVTFFSLVAICFLGYTLQLVAAFLDFVIFVGYLASAALLRHNYHVRNSRNPLRNELINLRLLNGYDGRRVRTDGLVKLLVALVVIQTILFFITTLLSTMVAMKDKRERGGGTFREKRGANDGTVTGTTAV
ncbi:hypothetical protein RUND412_007130 [Rhizina undulata]